MEKKEEKQCSGCKVKKSIDQFRNENRNCNSCIARWVRYKQNHPERVQRYYEENKERFLEEKKEYRKMYNRREEMCEVCNYTIKTCRRAHHRKTQIHLANLEKIEAKNN